MFHWPYGSGCWVWGVFLSSLRQSVSFSSKLICMCLGRKWTPEEPPKLLSNFFSIHVSPVRGDGVRKLFKFVFKFPPTTVDGYGWRWCYWKAEVMLFVDRLACVDFRCHLLRGTSLSKLSTLVPYSHPLYCNQSWSFWKWCFSV